MNLIDKFKPYCDHEYANREDNAYNCMEIAEDFAVRFAGWLSDNAYNDDSKFAWRMYDTKDEEYTIEELLEIYKEGQC